MKETNLVSVISFPNKSTIFIIHQMKSIMSGSVSPGYGRLIIFLFGLLALFVVGYGFVLGDLIWYDNHSVPLRIIVGAITPGLIGFSWGVSLLFKNKATTIVAIVLLIILNVLYVAGLFDRFIPLDVLTGARSLMATSLIVVSATMGSILFLSGFSWWLYWLNSKLHF